MYFIHILLSLLFVHIATAHSGHGSGDSDGHSLNKRSPFAPGSDGICYIYTIQQGDTCAALAKRYQLTTSNIEAWNVGAWDWTGCGNVKQGSFICLSSGALPMPVALPHAVCGPQVPGTRRPANYADLASLNQCSSNQCCSKFGQCGTSSDYCNASSGCLFNCGPKSTQKEVTTKSATSRTTTLKTSTTKTATKPTTSKSTTEKTTTEKVNMVTMTSIEVVTKTTSSVAPSATWQMTIYEGAGCTGDYFSLQGHETQDTENCIILADNTDTTISDTTTSCRWWTNGGLNWGTCASSKVAKPKSFYLTRGKCYMYSGTKCVDEDWIGETYAAFKGCQDDRTGYLSPRKGQAWGSLKCFEYISGSI